MKKIPGVESYVAPNASGTQTEKVMFEKKKIVHHISVGVCFRVKFQVAPNSVVSKVE